MVVHGVVVVLPVSGAVHVPVSDQCTKCGADLIEPAFAELDQLPFMADKSRDELVELDYQDLSGRLAALELRAELHDRLGQADLAKQDRLQAVRELEPVIGASMKSADVPDLTGLIMWRAVMNERADNPTEAARDRLLAADIHAARAGESGAKNAALASPLTVAAGGLALGAEWADAARAGVQHNELKEARLARQELMQTGRAVGLGICGQCEQVVEVSADGRCPSNHKVELRRYVVPEDADATRAELAGQASAGAH